MKGLLVAFAVLAVTQASVIKFEQARDAFQGLKSAVQGIEDIFIKPTETESENEIQESAAAGAPDFCRSLDCPKFTVITTTKDYEERQYEMSNWVSTQMTAIDHRSVYMKMFMKLFKYISGNNAAKEKIAMTTPVINKIIPGAGPACENTFTMSFFMSPKVTDIPAPSDSTVYLDKLPKLTAYVRSFGGFASDKDFIDNAKELQAALPASAKYHTDFYYAATYNSPFEIFNRHNEVWFIAM